jgi:hypothetical protein
MRQFIPLVILAVATTSPVVLLAQDVRGLTDGQQVRILVRGATRYRMQATFIARDGDTLVLRDARARANAPVVRVGFGAIERVEVQHARSRAAGALRGLAIGALAGTLAGGMYGFLGDDNDPEFGTVPAAVHWGAVGLTTGVVAGTLIGLAAPGHRWMTLELPARVGLAPIGRNGVALTLSIGTR